MVDFDRHRGNRSHTCGAVNPNRRNKEKLSGYNNGKRSRNACGICTPSTAVATNNTLFNGIGNFSSRIMHIGSGIIKRQHLYRLKTKKRAVERRHTARRKPYLPFCRDKENTEVAKLEFAKGIKLSAHKFHLFIQTTHSRLISNPFCTGYR